MDSDRQTLDGVLNVELVAAPHYFIGLPFIVSVSWINDTKDATLFGVPELDVAFYQGGRISVTLEPEDSEGVALETGFPRAEEGQEGLTIEPGDKRRMICDLTNMGVVFHPGRYQLTLALVQPALYRSNTVPVHLTALNNQDRLEADRLRRLGLEGDLDTGAWRFFLDNNPHAVKVASTMHPDARKQLALHLFLQRAMWTPRHLSHVDPAPLRSIQGPHLDAEVAALSYELQHARHDPHAAATRAAMLAHYPGLRHRAESADAGKGLLADFRSTYGIEGDFFGNEAPHPYGK